MLLHHDSAKILARDLAKVIGLACRFSMLGSAWPLALQASQQTTINKE